MNITETVNELEERLSAYLSEKAVKILCSMKFSNGINQLVQPKVYTRNEWYNAQIEPVKSALDALGRLALLFRL